MLTLYPAEGYDSLASVEDADAYWQGMGGEWFGTVAEKEAALRRGTQYVMALRPTIAALTVMHPNLKAAVFEAAQRAMTGVLYEDIAAQSVTMEEVGPIKTVYAQSSSGGRRRFPIIEDLLRGLVSGSHQIRVERA